MAGYVHYSVPKWIEENKQFFLPPVCNKMMHGDGQLKVFYVGGPNVRKDFHIEEGEELFYMVKGDMTLIVIENNVFKNIKIKEGEIFLLPGRIPHSPQRFENTIGLVIERERLRTEFDCLRYFVEDTLQTLYEKWFYCEDLGTQLGPIIKEYFASEQHKTGKPIPGTITENPPWNNDDLRKLEAPFSLAKWISDNSDKINKAGKLSIFDSSYKSEIVVYGSSETSHCAEIEHWIWQIDGESKVVINGETKIMKHEDSVLVKSSIAFTLSVPKGSFTMVVKMNPKK